MITKFDIACMIERLPGNVPWSASSNATLLVDYYTKSELKDFYNSRVISRGLDLPLL